VKQQLSTLQTEMIEQAAAVSGRINDQCGNDAKWLALFSLYRMPPCYRRRRMSLQRCFCLCLPALILLGASTPTCWEPFGSFGGATRGQVS
jgi:hypothetical protein